MIVTADIDLGGILKLWTHLEAFYGGAWEKMEAAQSLYDHKFPWLKEQVPEGMDIHEPSTASSIIDHFRDNVRVQNIIPQRDDWGTSVEARAKKALLLRLDKWVIDKFREQGPVDPFTQTIFDMSLRGAGAWQLGYDDRRWPEEPEGLKGTAKKEWLQERGMRFPLWLRPVDPLTIAPAPSYEFPMPWCMVKKTMTVFEAMELYPQYAPVAKRLTEASRKPATIVTVLELWSAPDYGTNDKGVHKVVVDNQMVVERENPFGVVPFVYEFSGYGRIDQDASPASLAVNLLEKATSELIAEARIKTNADAIWQFTAWPRLMTTEDPRSVKIQWDMSAGGILRVSGLGPDNRPQWLDQPQVDAAMWNFLPMVLKSIEKATFSSVLEGQRTPGVDFGYLQALLVGQASLRKDNVIGMASRMFARGVSLAERIISNLDIGPFVLGPGVEGEKSRTVSAADIGNRYDLNVIIEASDPAERDRRMIAWATPLNAGAVSKRTYLQNGMMFDDPDEELATVYAEKVVEQLLMSGMMAEQILSELQADKANENLEGMTGELVNQVRGQVGGLVTGASGQPGASSPAESPVEESPMSVVKKMQAANQKSSSLQMRA